MEQRETSSVNEKSCTPIPCPSFGNVELDVLGVCNCFGLVAGELYAPGCPVHDPTQVDLTT